MAPPIEFGVMGPIRAAAGGVELRVGGPRERAVLARLVLDANRVVSVDRLIDAVWPGEPPASARGQIAICVSRLRRALGAAARVITTVSPGYMVRLDEDGADWLRFNGLLNRAKAGAATGERSAAATLLREALGLWRGAPFEDLPGLRPDATRLQAARLDAVETCADLELRLGRYDWVSKELALVVAEHPLRERARAQLMLAHYRAGRRADALRTYQEARRALVEQIGLEPGPELRGLHEQILRDEPVLVVRPVAEPAPIAPSQLPRQPLPFAGRAVELAELEAGLGDGADAPGTVVLSGPGEVGKTALGLRWAHRRIDRFPDGQLHAELVDDLGRPVPSEVVLDRFLRALRGPGTSIPDDPGEKAALYRSMVARRRLLVFLDGAVDFGQIRPLLPGGSGARVIVTSREPMDELVARQGAHQIMLPPLSHEESLTLLGMLLGPDWVAGEPHEAGRLVALAQGFPLPLRWAAARVRTEAHRHRPLGELASVSA
jgi:DNA-binding SARP family transcriptional activator